MFHVLSQNDKLRQIRYKKIFEFIEKHEKDLPEKHEMLITKMEKIYYLGWIKALLKNLGIETKIPSYGWVFNEKFADYIGDAAKVGGNAYKAKLNREAAENARIRQIEAFAKQEKTRQENEAKVKALKYHAESGGVPFEELPFDEQEKLING